MSWYKKAQQRNNEWKWNEFLKAISIPVLAGFTIWAGISMNNLKNDYIQNPQDVEKRVIEYQQNNQEQEKAYSDSFNLKEVADMIERHEEKRNKVYLDTKGIPTVGIGFNLKQTDAREKIEEVGANYNNILNGRESLTDQQVYNLFNHSLNEAISIAQRFLPNFNEHPAQIQSILINMAFNLGANKLSGFKNFKAALLNKNYQTAANEMINSDWYSQVGNRSKELVGIMRSVN